MQAAMKAGIKLVACTMSMDVMGIRPRSSSTAWSSAASAPILATRRKPTSTCSYSRPYRQ